MDSFERALGDIDGGRVLDVATQQGRFVQVLAESLKSYTEIVGIDIGEKGIEAAREAIDAQNVSFSVMDAEKLEFEDESFDTVGISASLHHMANLPVVLDEMMRVLKPGGHFIVLEMHRDAATEPERTSARLHGWAAEMDVAMGRVHHPVMTRDEIRQHVAKLGLSDVQSHELDDRDADPTEVERIEHLEKVIGMLTERAAGLDDRGDLVERGGELLERVHATGAQGEPVIAILGRK